MLYVLTTFFVCLNERRFETSPLLLACSLENFPDYRAKFTAERGKPRGAPNLFGPEYDYYSTPLSLPLDRPRSTFKGLGEYRYDQGVIASKKW